jgi:hypothetical protein
VESEPQGAENFGRSWYTEVSALGQTKVVPVFKNHNSYKIGSLPKNMKNLIFNSKAVQIGSYKAEVGAGAGSRAESF